MNNECRYESNKYCSQTQWSFQVLLNVVVVVYLYFTLKWQPNECRYLKHISLVTIRSQDPLFNSFYKSSCRESSVIEPVKTFIVRCWGKSKNINQLFNNESRGQRLAKFHSFVLNCTLCSFDHVWACPCPVAIKKFYSNIVHGHVKMLGG